MVKSFIALSPIRAGWVKLVFLGLCALAISTPSGVKSSPMDSVPYYPICNIQGSGFVSPLAGQTVRTQGVVYADLDETSMKGFFVQFSNCDSDPSTSDGLFVFLSERTNVVDPGNLVEVVGLVQEYYWMTEISAKPGNVSMLSKGNPLPLPISLDPPTDNTAAQVYFESLEGMLVSINEAVVVGPTSERDETWVVSAALGISRVFRDDPVGSSQVVCVDDGGLYEIAPEARVGDWVSDLLGYLEYTYGLYRLQLLAQPNLITSPMVFEPLGVFSDLSVATFNLEELFDTVDDPGVDDPVVSAAEYQRKLEKLARAIHDGMREPTLVAVQEAENQDVLLDLVMRPEIESDYGILWEDGPDQRGIDVALLYRLDRANVLGYEQRQGCTMLVDGLGPDGNGDVTNPQNILTCDSNGDGNLDGNRLFSRPPLVAYLSILDASGQEATKLWVIANHWKSKTEDTPDKEYTLPRRIEQAQFVAGLSLEVQRAHPEARLVVLGDLNDFPDSQPLRELETIGLENLANIVVREKRYTYIYHGLSQVLEHVLVNDRFQGQMMIPVMVHINADYPWELARQAGTFWRSSDHDPLVVEIVRIEGTVFLPLVFK